MNTKEMQNNLTVDDIYNFMDLFFDRYNIIYSHCINSFNKFVEEDVKLYLENSDNTFFEKITKDKLIKYKFKFENISFKEPTLENSEPLFPLDAQKRKLTYKGRLLAKVTQLQEVTDVDTGEITTKIIGKEVDNVPVADIPVMVKSKFCTLTTHKGMDKKDDYLDPGCCFIVNGSEKVVISQDRMCDNKPLVFLKKDSGVENYTVQVNSRSHKPHGITQIINIRIRKDGMTIRVPILNEIPVFILFRALGIEKDEDIVNYCVYDTSDVDMIDVIRTSLDACKDELGKKIQTKQDAIEYLVNKLRVVKKYSDIDKKAKHEQRKIHLEDLLANNLLPHCEGDLKTKAMYFGYMIHKLIDCYLERTQPDDRDSYVNKRIDLPGDLLMELFKQFYRKMMNECNKYFKKRSTSDEDPLNIINQIRPNIIEQGIKASLLTGAWPRKKGVAQMLQRFSYSQTISFFRRVDSPGGDASSSKLTTPRNLHPSSVSFLCPVATPEHSKVGLTKHLSLIGSISITHSAQIYIIKSYLKKKLIDNRDIPSGKIKDYSKVFLNGEWLGLTNEPLVLETDVKNKKLNGTFEPTISIVHDIPNKDVKIYCDGGRLFRPVITVKDNVALLDKKHIGSISLNKADKGSKITSWNEFMIKNPGVLEYIDMEEQNFLMIASDVSDVEEERKKMTESISKVKNVTGGNVINRYDDMMYVKYTHSEFHPSLLVSEIPVNIPFCNHNAGPRNIFNYSQARQAMGIYISNYRERLDISYVLYHPQSRLISTRASKYVYSDVLAYGENVTVAIACYTGYNQEDSLVFNLSALDRGLFRSMNLKKHIAEIQKNQSTSQDDVFMKPDQSKVSGMRPGSYDKLNDKGYIPEETFIVNGDVLIGKVTPNQTNGPNDKPYRDSSEIYKSHAPGVVDKVFANIQNSEGYDMRKIRVRSDRKPRIGDKFACYTPDHDVLTDKGWVNITQITKQHKIATLKNKKTLEYQFPTEVMSYDYDGQIYVVDSAQVDLKVTPNHRMFVGNRGGKYEILEANKIYNQRKYYMKCVEDYDTTSNVKQQFTELVIENNVITHFKLPAYKDRPELKIPINSWLVLFGIWLAEGCCGANTSIAANKERVREAIDAIEADLQVNICKTASNKSKNGENDKYDISDKRYLTYFKPLSVTAPYKDFPEWVWLLNMNQARLLVESVVKGDGHYMKNGTKRYDTSSIKLANGFQRLCLHAGWSANLYLKYKAGHESIMFKGTEKEQIITANFDSHRLTIVEKQNYPLVNKNIKFNKNNKVEKLLDKNDKVEEKLLDKSDKKLSKNIKVEEKLLDKSEKSSKNNKTEKILDKVNEKLLGKSDKLTSNKVDEKLLDSKKSIKSNKSDKVEEKPVKYVKSTSNETNENNEEIEEDNIDDNKTGALDRYENYKGKVYCCTVPGDGVIYVRRNGLVVWCGNSAHGQKGTIGITLKQSDMPFTKNGITPDICLNPNAIPSRMTVGQLIESLLGKRVALDGKEADGTPFVKVDINAIQKELEGLGYNGNGLEYMYNGMTGEKLQNMIFIGPVYYQRLKHQVEDKIHCILSGTQVLTSDGWKFGSDILMSDHIATLKNGKLVYEKPIQIMHYPDYEGQMYYIKNQAIDLAVTGNHRMWVAKVIGRKKQMSPFRFELARDVAGKHRFYKKDAEWDAPDYQFVLPYYVHTTPITLEMTHCEEIDVNMDDWLTFFGIWYAEGCTSGGVNQIAVHKQRVKDALYPALTNMGFKFTVYNDVLNIRDKQLADYMKPLSVGAVNKKLPEWVFKLSKNQTRKLIQSMILGDGCYTETNEVYYTSSKVLADQVQQLCLHAGWAAMISVHIKAGNETEIRGKKVVNNYDTLRISIIKNRINPSVNHGHTQTQKVQEERLVENEKCPVFCLQVPSEVFYIRRNGKAVWTGNSRSRGPRTMMTHQPSEGRSREGGLRLGEMERDSLLAHGMAKFLKEKLLDTSDAYSTYVCDKCGLFAQRKIRKTNKDYSTNNDVYYCPGCNNYTDTSKILIPYAFKLLVQELMAMNIAPRIRAKKDAYGN